MARRSVRPAQRQGAVLVVLAALGAFVAFWRLDVPGWGVDEVIYAEAAEAYARGEFELNRGHAWLSKLLMAGSIRLLGDGELAVRLPGAALGFLTGLVLWALGRRLAGPAAGLVAAGLWWLLPLAPGTALLRFDRYGNLEPAMLFFGALALLAATVWIDSGRARWAVLAGLFVGLSASSKFTGAALAPAVAVPVLWVADSARHRAAQLAAMAAAAVAGLALPYLAAGRDGLTALREGVELQFGNNTEGHLQIVAGTLYRKPPWWSHLWWQQEYLSLPGIVLLWGLAIAGVVLLARAKDGLNRAAAALLALALAAPALALLQSSRKLPHYHLILVPTLVVAAGVGVAIMWRWWPSRLLAGAGVIVLAILGLLQVARAATVEPDAYRLAARQLQAAGATRTVLVFGWSHVLDAEMPGVKSLGAAPPQPPEAIVVDPVTRDRFRGSDLDRYVSSVASGYERSRAGRLTVYVRRDL